MRLVDDEQPVRREVVEQRPRPRARPRGATGGASSSRCRCSSRARASSRGRTSSAGGAARASSARPSASSSPTRSSISASMSTIASLSLSGRRDVVGRRVDVDLLALGEQLAGQRVELGDPLDLVAEELDPDERLLGGRLELERVAADAEPGAASAAASLRWYWRSTRWRRTRVAPVLAADPELEHGRAVVDRRAEAVDARHATRR